MVPLMSDCIPPPLLGRSAGLLLFANGFGPAVGYAVIGEFKSQNRSTMKGKVMKDSPVTHNVISYCCHCKRSTIKLRNGK